MELWRQLQALGHADRWAARELAPWRGRGLTRQGVEAAVAAAAAQHGGTFRYDISQEQVVHHAKSGAFLGSGVDPGLVQLVANRAQAYCALLQQALPLLRIDKGFSLALDVSDIAPDIPDLPLFAFQKPLGSPLILLPDVDLLGLDFLEDARWTDRLTFQEKQNKAHFIGASTGGRITQEAIARLSIPRLRAAVAFKDSPHVSFTLSDIVQYDTAETRQAVEALGVGGTPMDWDAQLAHRHILSMDGNGATWSRVAKVLKSNSVLVKYDSPWQLFYFRGLKPWIHYAPVATDAEVEDLVLDSARRPARYARIAINGRRFYDSYLRRDRCVEYVAALLQGYQDMLDSGDGRRAARLRARTHYHLVGARRLAGRLVRALRRREPTASA